MTHPDMAEAPSATSTSSGSDDNNRNTTSSSNTDDNHSSNVNRRAVVWADLNLSRFALTGAVAASAADAALYPLEVVKTRLQASGEVLASRGHDRGFESGLLECVRRTWRLEGLRGFTRGFGAQAAAAVPMQFLSFGTYEFAKHALHTEILKLRGRGRRRHDDAEDSGVDAEDAELFTEREELAVDFMAGAAGEVASGIVWVPTDIVTQKLQVQGPNTSAHRYSGGWDCLTRILADEGIAGLYRGLGPTLATYVPSTAVQFASYQYFRRRLYGMPGLRESDEESHPINIAAGAAAGALAACVANPIDVVKTRVQTHEHGEMPHFFRLVGMVPRHVYPTVRPKYHSTVQGLRLIVREEGLRGLTRGMSARILTMAPYSALTFGIYEVIKLMSLSEPS
jgi:solute carrier family 25, member 44